MTDSIAKIAYIPERVVRLAGCITRSLEVIRSMHSEEVQCKCVIPNHVPVGISSWIQYMQCIRMMLISIAPKEKLMCTAVASFTFLPVLQVAPLAQRRDLRASTLLRRAQTCAHVPKLTSVRTKVHQTCVQCIRNGDVCHCSSTQSASSMLTRVPITRLTTLPIGEPDVTISLCCGR